MLVFTLNWALDAAVVTFLLLSTVRLVVGESGPGFAASARRFLNVLLVPFGIVFAYRVGSILLAMFS